MKKIFIFLSLSILAHFSVIEPMERVETKETLFFGCGASILSRDTHSKTSYRVYNHYSSRYYKEVRIPGNISLLQSIFGRNVQLREGKPHPSRKGDAYCVSHYRAVKSHEETVMPGSEIDIHKSPYSGKIGDYTIQGRYFFPVKKASDELDQHYCFVDAEKNIYYVSYPECFAHCGALLAFVNKVLGKSFVELHRIDGFLKRSHGPVKLSDLSMNSGTHIFGLDGPYGCDIPWNEHPFEFQDVPVIEHKVTRDELPVWAPPALTPAVAEEVRAAQLSLLEKILRCCGCFRKRTVKVF